MKEFSLGAALEIFRKSTGSDLLRKSAALSLKFRAVYLVFATKQPNLAKTKRPNILPLRVATISMTSVTKLGDLLDFGQVFKAFGRN